MSTNKTEEQLHLTPLLFEANKEGEELNFPQICKFVRRTFNVNQVTMAKRLGVNLSAYRYWEHGKREPSGKAAANLCFLYLQCLYLDKQIPGATEIKQLLASLVNKQSSTETKEQVQTMVAA